jgi:two-component system, cell cycle sensor histidine kinase and response regulator CckA
MEKHEPTREELSAKIRTLEERLWEAEQTLEAIQNGEVDALVIHKPTGDQLYTLTGADHGYRILVESVSEGAVILSSDDSIYYCNRTLGEMLQVPIQKISGRKLDSYVASESRPGLLKLIKESHNLGVARGEFLMKRNDGTLLPVNVSLNSISLEDFEGVGAVITDLSEQKQVEEELRRHRTKLERMVKERTADLATANAELLKEITERKRTEEVLRESEARFSTIFHASPLSIAMTRLADNQVVDVNETWQNLTGFTREEAIGRTPLELNTWVDFNDRDRLIRMLREQGTVTGFEMLMRQKSGAIRNLIMAAELIELLGEPLMLSVAVDITDRKQVEAERAQLEAQTLQLQKAESLGRMAGAIAHHFNNQLGIVMGNLELAMIDLPEGTQAHANITEAMKGARKAAEVSGLMLTYLGQTSGIREVLDLSEVCRRGLPLLQAVIPKEVVLDHNLPSPGPTIPANASQIQLILTNLITNAWEACGERLGAIHLVVKAVPSAETSATHRFPIDWQPQDNAYACLEVTDIGCGIGYKDIEKVFDPFFSSKFTGRGLGLSVVLGLVRAHGGVVTVESEPGRGSVFRVFFPMTREADARQPEKVIKAPEMEGGGTVLLVDDEQVLRRMVVVMLTRLGFAALEAEDGVEAVEVFRQHKDEIRCVLCDLTMPRKNGWETIETLRALRPDVPVVLASGYDEAKVMAGRHAELPQAFLHKPFTMAELKAALGAAMGTPLPKE